MKYECLEETCKKQFLFPAKISKPLTEKSGTVILQTMAVQGDMIETHVCPYCQSLNIQETTAPTQGIANVYIYELTTGAQTELDKLLAAGYQIVNRYSKQYHLEKPKPAEVKP